MVVFANDLLQSRYLFLNHPNKILFISMELYCQLINSTRLPYLTLIQFKQFQFASMLLIYLLVQLAHPMTYPQQLNSIQWVHQSNWLNCYSLKPNLASNCGSELIQKECYSIPTEGLCLNGKASIDSQRENNLQFYAQVQEETQITISINQLQYQFSLHPQQNYYNKVISLTENQLDVKIASSSKKYVAIADFNILDQCQKNCLTCINESCEMCQEDYFYYNFQCTPLKCYERLDTVEQNSYKMKSTLREGKIVVEASFDGMELGECLVARVYLIDSLENPVVSHIFAQDDVRLIGENELELSIPYTGSELGSSFETEEFLVRKLIFSMSLTLMERVQYLVQGIAQVKIRKSVEGSVEMKEQHFQVSEDCCQSAIEVLGVLEVGEVDLESQSQSISIEITIADPQYFDYSVSYESGQLVTSDGMVDLQLVKVSREGNQISMKFKMDTYVESRSMIKDVKIECKLVNARRVLELRSDAVFQYKLVYVNQFEIEDKEDYQHSKSEDKKTLTNRTIILVVINIVIFMIMLVNLESIYLTQTLVWIIVKRKWEQRGREIERKRTREDMEVKDQQMQQSNNLVMFEKKENDKTDNQDFQMEIESEKKKPLSHFEIKEYQCSKSTPNHSASNLKDVLLLKFYRLQEQMSQIELNECKGSMNNTFQGEQLKNE